MDEMNSILDLFQRPTEYNSTLALERQKKFITNDLTSFEKMDLYDSGVKGELEKLKDVIQNKKYNVFEECSAKGYYWTVLHYAAHYGHFPIVKYIVEMYCDHPNKLELMNIQSNLGMTPLLIAIANGPVKEKKPILELFLAHDLVDFTICSQKGEDIFEHCKKAGLLEYFCSLIKED